MNVGELKVQAIVETTAVKQGADKFVGELNRMDNATLKQIKNIGQLTAGYFAIGPVLQNFGRQSITSFLESESASKTLSAALKGNQADIEKLTKQAAELQSKTIFSDEQIMNAQAMFGFMGKNSTEIEKLMPLVINLGAAQEKTGNGMANLTQIAKLLSRSTGEELGPRLEMLIGPLTENEKQMLKNAQGMDRINLLTDIMSKRFGDIGFQIEDTASQWKNLSNQVDEFKEGFGKGLIESVNNGIKALQRLRGENEKTQLSISDLGYIIAKALAGPITNVIDLLGWLESKYSDTFNSIQQTVVGFLSYMQSNPVLKFLIPGLSSVDLEGFTTQRSQGDNTGGVTGTGEGDRAKMFSSKFVKTKKDGSGNKTNSGNEMTPEEELNFIQKFREEIKALEEDEKSLTAQLAEENLLMYERVAILAKLEEVQKRLNEMRGAGQMDVSGKIGDLDALRSMLNELPDDPSFVKAGKPFTGSKQSGPAEEPTGLDLGAMVQVAQNIHNILNQPLDNPFKIMQAMLQIAMQIGTLLSGAGAMGAGGGLLSFLGPIGGIVNLVGGIFGGLLGMPKSGSASGGGMSENMKKMAEMFNTFRATGSIYNLPREFTQVAPANVNVNNGYDFTLNGRKVDRKFKEEINRDGIMLSAFNFRKKYS